MKRAGGVLTTIATTAAVALTTHTVANLRELRVPEDDPPTIDEQVSVLLPVRDEQDQVGACLEAITEQVCVPNLEILVLDDGSTDRTAEIVREAARRDPRVRLLKGAPLPSGWLGKPHACSQLADAAAGTALVFVDADVVLAPHAVAATITLLRGSGLDLVCPYPRQIALTAAERLVQPLLQWSWLTTLPLRAAERSPRPSLAAANGQLLAVDAAAYHRSGGHSSVRTEVLDDVALLRSVKRSGGSGVVVDGTHVATCRMYRGWEDLRDGYSKSLWAAFGSPAGALAVVTALTVIYVAPAAAALRGSTIGLVGYAAAVGGRYAVAERTGGRSLPDSLAHPVSIGMLAYLTGRSLWLRRRGRLLWKGRDVVAVARVST